MMARDPASEIEALKGEWPANIAVQCFDPDYFATLPDDRKSRFLKCLNSGVENPDSEMGCYACQPSDYDDFKPFFSRVLARYHKVPDNARHVNDWRLESVARLPEDGVLDVARLGLPALSMRVRTARNLKDFPLPDSMTKDDLIRLEEKMMAAFEILIDMPDFGGRYYSLTPGNPCFIDDQTYQDLVDAHIMFKNMDADRYLTAAGIAADWPFGRGCYVSADKRAIIWVGEEDHLRIMCMQTGTVLGDVFDRLKTTLDLVEEIDVSRSPTRRTMAWSPPARQISARGCGRRFIFLCRASQPTEPTRGSKRSPDRWAFRCGVSAASIRQSGRTGLSTFRPEQGSASPRRKFS